MMEGAVCVSNLWKYFGGSGLFSKWSDKVPVLQGLTFELKPGELAALVGESGSGKTTLGRCLMGLLPFEDGTARVNGFDVTNMTAREEKDFRMSAQMVFQNPYASLNPAFKVRDALTEAVRIHDPSSSRNRAREEVYKLARLVQLPAPRLDEFPTSLSGGEKRRVIFARALATRPRFVVMDEPVSGLDQPIQTQLLDLLRQIHERQKTTMIFISHDLRLVRFLAARVIVLLHGKIVEDAPTEVFFKTGPAHPYSRDLLHSAFNPVTDIEAHKVRKPPAKGLCGCTFRHRCTMPRVDKCGPCQTVTPELIEIAPGHRVACHCVDEDEKKVV